MTTMTLATAFALTIANVASAVEDHLADLAGLANTTISDWIASPIVLDAVRAQNLRSAGLLEDQILTLDATWREQSVYEGDFVEAVLSNKLSQHLKSLKMDGKGRFSEIFISDIRGLNGGQSGLTSDYWQGDEDKWQIPHATSDIHIGGVEFDESKAIKARSAFQSSKTANLWA